MKFGEQPIESEYSNFDAYLKNPEIALIEIDSDAKNKGGRPSKLQNISLNDETISEFEEFTDKNVKDDDD